MDIPGKLSTNEEIRKQWLEDGTNVGLVGMYDRLGMKSFTVFLEYYHFPPKTPANDQYQLISMEFCDMHWVMVIIPRDKLPIADKLLNQLGLKRIEGHPLVISGGKMQHFPYDLPNVYTIENVPGHFVYHNDPKLRKTADQLELEAINKVFVQFGDPPWPE